MHYLFLAPIVIFGIASSALLDQSVLVLSVIALTGLTGAIIGRKSLMIIASVALLSLLIWGKVAADLWKTSQPDTGFFLVQFGVVLFFMEADLVLLTYKKSYEELAMREDQLSAAIERGLGIWLRNNLSRQGEIAVGSIGLSLLLLPLAGFTSISSSQLPLTGALLLLAITALFFLVTHRREPEKS